MATDKKYQSRRDFIKKIGIGAGASLAFATLNPITMISKQRDEDYPLSNKMTYRVQHKTGEKISLLGFGMMRLPQGQESVNELVDYAIKNGVNYFDTAPMYLRGESEKITGNALSRHPRESYYVATKMSNYDKKYWNLENAKQMYENSFRNLKVDDIDYYLLHGVGQGGMENLKQRFLDNGVLDFLLEERRVGRIKHLGFSYHGDVEVFDYLVERNPKYKWDFVQIQMNYLDWRHASLSERSWAKDADAEYLYSKLEKFNIQAVIMEPLRGGALASIPDEYAAKLKELRPDSSISEWAFRWVGSKPNILTVLSGMNKMEHLVENIKTYSPIEICTNSENQVLEEIADGISGIPTIPCTTCGYCMPCPFGVDIPGNFSLYNKAIQNQTIKNKSFAADYNNTFKVEERASQCVDCEACLPKCPQQIRIPNQMRRISEVLKNSLKEK